MSPSYPAFLPCSGEAAADNSATRGRSGIVAEVTHERLLAQLEALALRLGLVVRVESFHEEIFQSRGGLCRVRGRPTVLVNSAHSRGDRIRTLAEALSAFDLDAIYLPPLVRERIESARS